MTDPEAQLKSALEECAKLRAENTSLRQQLGLNVETTKLIENSQRNATVKNSSPTEEKVKLFRSYFRGREDIYALRWEGKDGKKGYSPACSHDWDSIFQRHDVYTHFYNSKTECFLSKNDALFLNTPVKSGLSG